MSTFDDFMLPFHSNYRNDNSNKNISDDEPNKYNSVPNYIPKHNNIPFTHWGRVTHICVGKLITIGSYNGQSPDRRQAIFWTNVGLLSIGTLRTYFSENSIKMQQYSLKKMHVKMSSAKWRPSCLGLNVLSDWTSSHTGTSLTHKD